jgi:anti-sigma B factor antagonist
LPNGDVNRTKDAADRRARLIASEASVRACEMDARQADGRTTLLLSGEFDASCVLRFERLVRAAMDDPLPFLVIDLREVTFIDSTGLALLLRTEAASRQDGFELQIVRSPAAAVRSALEVSGLERVLPFVERPD